MSAAHKLKTLESMMLYHCKANTGIDRLQTMLSTGDLRQMGCQEFGGKWTHQVRHGENWKTFEIVPRSA